MKKRNTLIATSLVLAAFAGLSAEAMACSYYIDDTAKRNELIAAVASELHISLETTKKIRVDGYRWWESIPTPMCPEELTYVANVLMEYEVEGETSSHCVAKLAVTKKENWETNLDTFEFAIIQTPACTPL